MKIFSLLCFIIFLESCANKSSVDSAVGQDSVARTDELTITPEPSTENPRGKTELEEAMKSFKDISNPKTDLKGISRLSFNSQHEYFNETITYFVDQKSYLRYFISDMADEGGHQETRYEAYEGDDPMRRRELLRIMYREFDAGDSKGTFGFLENDRLVYYRMAFNAEGNPMVTLEVVDSISRNRNFQTHVTAAVEYSKLFKLKGGTYQYYLRQDTVKSENGPVEVLEYYEIDSALFNKIVRRY